MPIMPNGTFRGIDEVKGDLAFAENVSCVIRRNAPKHYGTAIENRLEEFDAKAAELRAIVTEYEERIK